MKQQTVILYARVNRKERAKSKLALQEKMMRLYCTSHKINVAAVYKDIAGGSSFDRPAFTELLEYAAQNKEAIDFLCVANIDRFSRNFPEAVLMEQRLNEMGIKVMAISQPKLSFAAKTFGIL